MCPFEELLSFACLQLELNMIEIRLKRLRNKVKKKHLKLRKAIG